MWAACNRESLSVIQFETEKRRLFPGREKWAAGRKLSPVQTHQQAPVPFKYQIVAIVCVLCTDVFFLHLHIREAFHFKDFRARSNVTVDICLPMSLSCLIARFSPDRVSM